MGLVSEQAGRYQRSPGALLGAMLVLVVIAVAMVLVTDAQNARTMPQPAPSVDYGQTLAYARKTADFKLLAPPRLPSGWRATSAGFMDQAGQSWHLGLLTPDEQYVGIEQSALPVSSMVEQYVDQNAVQGSSVQVAGHTWSTWTDSRGDTALVRVDKGMTTLVVGTVGRDRLVRFVTSLR